jgi:DNA-binding transcriptional regulator YiaG
MTKRAKACRLEQLLSEVRASVAVHGKKADLARFLDVPMPRVSEWLSGARSPGGEATLGLREWVRLQAEQTKNPERDATRPGRKTRQRKPKNEESKIRPPRT